MRNDSCSQVPDCRFISAVVVFCCFFLNTFSASAYKTALVLMGWEEGAELLIYEQKEKGILGMAGVKIHSVYWTLYSSSVKQGITS